MRINFLIGPAILGLVALGASVSANAVPTSDVQDYSNNTATEYFVDVDGNKENFPYYRRKNDDWGWTHGTIAGSGFTSITLEISAFDVDWPDELDMISIFDGSSWINFGDLDGGNDIWSFTSFDLTGYGWAEAQVNMGLQIRMDIDTARAGWAVTLAKSVLSVDGGNQGCVPTPGIPCVSTPEPTSLALIGLGLAGIGMSRRRKTKK